MTASVDDSVMRVLRTRHAVDGFTHVFFDALARSGVGEVVVSPGSRSTPLAIAAARCDRLRVFPVIDERSAGFFALGLARRAGRPVAILCTSGTAAANYLPAVIEAHYAGVPLIVLTADRPPELRAFGAGQTIDQLGLYGPYVRRCVELPIVDHLDDALTRYAEDVAWRAVADATGRPSGPVHLNCPLREPLEPLTESERALLEPDARAHGTPIRTELPSADRATAPSRGRLLESKAVVDALAQRALATERGVIVCGPLLPELGLADAIGELGRLLGWPILADPSSQLRSGAHCSEAPICASADLLLRDPAFVAAHRADIVLRFGASPVSKAFRLWIEAAPPAALWLVDPDGERNDPGHRASQIITADPQALCRDLSSRIAAPRKSPWREAFVEADRRAGLAVSRAIASEPAMLEPRVVTELLARLPEDACLYVSNSMPIRDLDAVMPLCERRIAVHANRGANGIDGVVSSAVGAAAAGGGRVVLLIGDLAMLHDVGGLLAARTQGIPLTIVVMNNDGGGIFSFLPIAEQGEAVDFESLFRTPHGVTFESAAALYGASHVRADHWDEFRDAVERALASDAGVQLIEVPIDRDANVAHFRALVRIASEAIHGGAPS